jgi:hypothetical protein
MAGPAAARALTRRAAGRTARFEFGLATADDDVEIRQLLRETPLPGEIALGLEREPDSRLAATIEGDVHQTILARDRGTGRLAAIASRSLHDAFIDGQPTRLGYLGQLRVAAPFRASPTLLAAGFEFCRKLHATGNAQVYLASIVSDNRAARRLLTGLRSDAAPRFTPVGTLNTLVIATRGRQRVMPPDGVRLIRGSEMLRAEVVDCLTRYGRRHQFARCWNTDALTSPERSRGLSASDFTVALRGDRVIGCVACWDQRAFKQTVVRGYSTRLARWRPVLNLIAPLTRAPYLPPVGRPLDFAYLSHFAVDDDRIDVAVALVAGARAALAADLDYAVIGLGHGHPVSHALVRQFSPRVYQSDLYLASWPDGHAIAETLAHSVPHPEVALL